MTAVKLVVAIVQDQDAGRLLEALMEKRFSATKLASTGGFLKEGNTTILTGVEDSDVDTVLDIIRSTCKSRRQLITPLTGLDRNLGSYVPNPVEVPVGGATVFVLDVKRFVRA